MEDGVAKLKAIMDAMEWGQAVDGITSFSYKGEVFEILETEEPMAEAVGAGWASPEFLRALSNTLLAFQAVVQKVTTDAAATAKFLVIEKDLPSEVLYNHMVKVALAELLLAREEGVFTQRAGLTLLPRGIDHAKAA